MESIQDNDRWSRKIRKTALSRNMKGESFNEHLESTIGINGFEVNVMVVGSMTATGSLQDSLKEQCLSNCWVKYEERFKLLEGAVAKNMAWSNKKETAQRKFCFIFIEIENHCSSHYSGSFEANGFIIFLLKLIICC
jgi:hypothetical protein